MSVAKKIILVLWLALLGVAHAAVLAPSGNHNGQILNAGYDSESRGSIVYDGAQTSTVGYGEASTPTEGDKEKAAVGEGSHFANFAKSVAAETVETTAGRGYQSFSAFKRAEGVAGDGMAWHHVVEQTPANVEQFGAEAIHNTENLVRLPHGPGTIHNQISGFYSSKQPFTGGMTVRQWLSPQSFEEQAAFGRDAIQQFGGTP